MRTQKRSKGILLTAVAVLAALFVLVPFLWVLSTALKPDNELFLFPPRLLPGEFAWNNFADAWHLLDFPRYFFNSFMVTVPTAFFTVVVCSLAAYAFTRMNFKLRNACLLNTSRCV